jgi:hypothetical protein
MASEYLIRFAGRGVGDTANAWIMQESYIYFHACMCPPTMHALHSTTTGCIAGRARDMMKAAQNNAASKAAPPGPTQPSRWRRHMTTPTHLGKTHPPPRRHVLASPSTATPPAPPASRPPAVDARRPRQRLPRALTMRIGCTCLPRGRSSGQAEPHKAPTRGGAGHRLYKLRCCPQYSLPPCAQAALVASTKVCSLLYSITIVKQR